MAASIGSGVRVRLNFDESCHIICESSIYKSFWFLLNLERQKTIESFASELCGRFDISTDLQVELSLDGCLLPRWESTAILRDNDLVTVAAAAVDVSKKRSIEGDGWELSATLESNGRQHQKEKKRKRRMRSEVDGPLEKKRREEVNDMETVEEETTGCGGGGGEDQSSEKRTNREKRDTPLQEHTQERSQPSHGVEVNGAIGGVETDSGSPCVVASTFSTSAVEEYESQFGENVTVGYLVDEAENQLNEVGLAVNDSPDEVKRKSKRTRRSRRNRKSKNPTLLDPHPNLNIVSAQTFEASSRDVQRSTFQWQNADLRYSKPSANSHPQHIIFGDDDDGDPITPEQNLVIDRVADHLANQNVAAENICEGPICNEDTLSRPDKDRPGYEPKRSFQVVSPNDEQVSQLNGTRHDGGSQLEGAAAGEDRGARSCRRMPTASNSRGLSHEQKSRQIRSTMSDNSPFSNVQVFKRQRGTKLQCLPTPAEPRLTSNGSRVSVPTTCTKWQATENILDVRRSEPMKDYSVYELLMGPPRPGDVIAYKILELSDDYSPVLSSYKEAKVQKCVSATRIVELEPMKLQIPSQLKKSTGRFDLTIEDEHEILTNSVMQDDDQLISISWDLLLESRLVA